MIRSDLFWLQNSKFANPCTSQTYIILPPLAILHNKLNSIIALVDLEVSKDKRPYEKTVGVVDARDYNVSQQDDF